MGWERECAFGMDLSRFIGWWAGTPTLLERAAAELAGGGGVALGTLKRSAKTACNQGPVI